MNGSILLSQPCTAPTDRAPYLLEEVEEAGAAHPHHQGQQPRGRQRVLGRRPHVVEEGEGRNEVLQLKDPEEPEDPEGRGVEVDAGRPEDRLDVPVGWEAVPWWSWDERPGIGRRPVRQPSNRIRKTGIAEWNLKKRLRSYRVMVEGFVVVVVAVVVVVVVIAVTGFF